MALLAIWSLAFRLFFFFDLMAALLRREVCEFGSAIDLWEAGYGNLNVQTLESGVTFEHDHFVRVRCEQSGCVLMLVACGQEGEIAHAVVGCRFALMNVKTANKPVTLPGQYCGRAEFDYCIVTGDRAQEVLLPPLFPMGSQHRRSSNHLCCFSGIGGFASGIADVVGRDGYFLAVDSCSTALACLKLREPHMHTCNAFIEDTSWWAKAIHHNLSGLSASPPCPPFSGLGYQRGEDDPRAKSWPYLLLLIALVKPVHLALENVINIASASDFVARVVEVITQLGYVVNTRIIDADLFVPTKRARWFLLGVRTDCAASDASYVLRSGVAWDRPLVCVQDCISLNDEGPCARQAGLSKEMRGKYADPNLLPWKCYPRILNGVQVAPTVLRSYGHAHEFCPSYLFTHGGLHGFCVRIDEILRFATAAEVAALMGYGDCDSAIWQRLSMQTRWWQGLGDSVVPLVGSFVWGLLSAASICPVTQRRSGGDPWDVVWRLMLVHKKANSRRHAALNPDVFL